MPQLVLIKHASPEVIAGVPPEQWRLSEQGRSLVLRDLSAPARRVLELSGLGPALVVD